MPFGIPLVYDISAREKENFGRVVGQLNVVVVRFPESPDRIELDSRNMNSERMNKNIYDRKNGSRDRHSTTKLAGTTPG